ncbi:MAG: GNAT family N-acetyltransferase [Lewinellaceae bacterium]|nr:GNAT family N-acetyltransferase [Lewinellaceae bacterium]
MLQPNFQPFPALETSRLRLLRLEAGDAAAIFRLRSEPQIIKYLDRAPAESLEEAEIFMQNVLNGEAANDSILWALRLHNKPDLLGTIGFWRMQKEHFRAEIGYGMLPEYWGQGFISEAMAAVLEYGFQNMGLHSVEANANPDNKASIRVLEKQGFVQEAYFRENYYYNGKFFDSAIFSLLAPQ